MLKECATDVVRGFLRRCPTHGSVSMQVCLLWLQIDSLVNDVYCPRIWLVHYWTAPMSILYIHEVLVVWFLS